MLTRQSEINPSVTNLLSKSPFASFSRGLILMLCIDFKSEDICLSMALLVILGDPTTALPVRNACFGNVNHSYI